MVLFYNTDPCIEHHLMFHSLSMAKLVLAIFLSLTTIIMSLSPAPAPAPESSTEALYKASSTSVPPPSNKTCPVSSLKMNMCVDVLAGLVHIGIGPAVDAPCCPLFWGMVGMDAAMCLCRTMRGRVMDLNIFMPLALQLLLYCGQTPPEGFICPPPSLHHLHPLMYVSI